jgi:hypothetical protein
MRCFSLCAFDVHKALSNFGLVKLLSSTEILTEMVLFRIRWRKVAGSQAITGPQDRNGLTAAAAAGRNMKTTQTTPAVTGPAYSVMFCLRLLLSRSRKSFLPRTCFEGPRSHTRADVLPMSLHTQGIIANIKERRKATELRFTAETQIRSPLDLV